MPVIVLGTSFPNRTAAGRYWKISAPVVYQRLKRGWPLEQAVGAVAPDRTHKVCYNKWLHRQGIQERVCTKCGEQKPLDEYYRRHGKRAGEPTPQCKQCVNAGGGDARRLKRFGVTGAEWETIFDAQGRCCAICKSAEPRGKGWATDHDHSRGDLHVRGVLCTTCNLMLGLAADCTATLQAGITYLENSRNGE